MVDKFTPNSNNKLFEFAEYLKQKYGFISTYEDTNTLYVYQEDLGIYKPRFRHVPEIDIEAFTSLQGEASDANVAYVQGLIRKDSYKHIDDFDSNPKLICVKNGILDLETLNLMPHTKEIPFLRYIPTEWNPNATCPIFLKAINTTFSPINAGYLQQFVGYGLIPKNIYKKAMPIVGIPNSGKSKITEAIRTTFGGTDNASSLSMQDLSGTFLSADLEGKIFNIRAEVNSKDMKNGWEIFKTAVSTDKIPAQRKYGQPFQMENKAKFIFTSNSLPPVTDELGVYERFLIIVAEHDYEKYNDGDPDIDFKLSTEEEKSGILKWAVDGYKILREHGGFYPKVNNEEMKLLYNCWTGDSVSKYISARLIVDLEHELPKDSVYKDYCSFCMEEAYQSKAENAFWRAMKDRVNIVQRQVPSSQDTKRPYMVKGIKYNMEFKGNN
jgi:putative DNA primase/helicase